MPPSGPIKRKNLIFYLRRPGFEGPYSGGKHQFMLKDTLTISIPNPHQGNIGEDFLMRILKQAKVSRKEWEQL